MALMNLLVTMGRPDLDNTISIGRLRSRPSLLKKYSEGRGVGRRGLTRRKESGWRRLFFFRLSIVTFTIATIVGISSIVEASFKDSRTRRRENDRSSRSLKPISASRSTARYKGEILVEYKCPRDYVT